MLGQKMAIFRQTVVGQNFNFDPEFFKMGNFQPDVLYFWRKILGSEEKIFRHAKI